MGVLWFSWLINDREYMTGIDHSLSETEKAAKPRRKKGY